MAYPYPAPGGRAHDPSPRPLITGQRVIDTMFPLAKGGAAAIPGGFGTGKTMTQHQIAKWCDADIIIYVGCGERGNEMTQALQEFSELVDPPHRQEPDGSYRADRQHLNMPVAAREASIYTGITLAEYYRDMGYHTAMMADSTSRWAEALRVRSPAVWRRCPPMRAYPAYLPSRLAEFYERAGYVKTLNGAEGSVSVIGAVSPRAAISPSLSPRTPSGFTRCFWALDKSWLTPATIRPSTGTPYSEYLGDLGGWYYDNVGLRLYVRRERVANLLLQENNLMQIVKLIGSGRAARRPEAGPSRSPVLSRRLPAAERLSHAVDTYVPLEKQLKMMETILYLYDKCAALVAKQVPVSRLLATGLFDELVQMKYTVPNDDFSKLDAMQKDIDAKLAAVSQG